jgi:phytoene desaturase
MARIGVVGAGVGGLAAAARLAARGHAVSVFEASGDVGGKLGVIERRTDAGMFRFDTGPTVLTMPEVFAELFAATGDSIDKVLTLRELDPIIRYRFGDGTILTTTRDLESQAARFEQVLGAGAGVAWTSLIRRGEQMWDVVGERVLGRPLSIRTAAHGLMRPAEVRTVAFGRTLRQLGHKYLTDPRQRVLLDRYATYAGSDPRRAPAVMSVIPYLEHTSGAWHIEGGLGRLATALADRVCERGGTIRLKCPVIRISANSRGIESILLADGSTERYDVIVANVDATTLYGRLLSPRPRRVPVADSSSGFVMLLGVRGRTPSLAHHNVLFAESGYDAEFDSVFGRPGSPVADPVIYVSAPDDSAMHPPGHESWFVLVNAPRQGRDGRQGQMNWTVPGLASGYEDRIMAMLAARGLAVRERLVFSQVLTPADLQHRTGAPGGAIYGGALHGVHGSFRRPPNASPFRGLYLVGGSTHPGGGLPLVATSARIVANLIGPA